MGEEALIEFGADSFAPSPAHLAPELWLEHSLHAYGQSQNIIGRNEQTCLSIHDLFEGTIHTSRDDGLGAGHCFQDDRRKGIGGHLGMN
jgi:hypothetical protein